MIRRFDLNIDKVLEAWEPTHAIRELIANALDEQTLTATPSIQVYEARQNEWIIRDFGRGLSIEHLIQTENPEKIVSTTAIGKFGVGLKDALATLWRHNIQIEIMSRHGRITLERSSKHAFEDLLTLHACVEHSSEPEMIGTKISLLNCQTVFVEKAKEMFLVFRDQELLENTQYGQVLFNQQDQASIYLNGLKIAAEENFLFSYNITAPNAAIRKELNRERTNVGRAAYSDRIKSMLLSCQSAKITEALSRDLQLLNGGHNHDELGWLEVQAHACQLLQAQKNVVFVTAEERSEKPALIGYAQSDGLTAVTIPERLRAKVSAQSTNREEPVSLLSGYAQSFRDSFKYELVPSEQLSNQEQQVFQLTSDVFNMLGGRPAVVKQVLVSATMRPEDNCGFDADGTWEKSEGTIIIKRSVLSSRDRFLGTLLHEIAHALSGAADVSLPFENELTDLLGRVANTALSKDIALGPAESDSTGPKGLSRL